MARYNCLDEHNLVILQLLIPYAINKSVDVEEDCVKASINKDDIIQLGLENFLSDGGGTLTVCSECQFSTAEARLLQEHAEAEHRGVTRFYCNACDYKSYYRANIAEHQARRHAGQSCIVATFGCDSCELEMEHDQCTGAGDSAVLVLE